MSSFPDSCTIAEVTRADGAVAPAIWVGERQAVSVLVEALAMAFQQVDLQRPYQRVSHLISSIANLMRFYALEGQPALDERGFRPFLEKYMLKRSDGIPDLGLAPLSIKSLQTELRNIEEYSDFCEREYGYLPLLGIRTMPLRSAPTGQRAFWRLLGCNETDFFSHLAVRRRVKQPRVKLPGRRRNTGTAPGFVGMKEDFAWTLIQAERNPTFKALWLIGFFGGPRLSESLNLWICDVLPGTWREHFFPGDSFVHLPLVVVADPWHSTWCGQLGDQRKTRSTFLREVYGLNPRPEMSAQDGGALRGKAAGFKGTKWMNTDVVMRQLFWARNEAAELFEEVIVDVINTRNQMPRARLHPFLFVNTDRRKQALQGNMLGISNVRKAFERAVSRIGGTPYRFKQRPHGMRHLYKDMVSSLVGDDAGAVQTCLGHRSRDSQNVYGSLDMGAMRHAMASVASRAPQIP